MGIAGPLQKANAANEACKATHLSAFATITAIDCWRSPNATDVVSRHCETPARDMCAEPPDKARPSATRARTLMVQPSCKTVVIDFIFCDTPLNKFHWCTPLRDGVQNSRGNAA